MHKRLSWYFPQILFVILSSISKDGNGTKTIPKNFKIFTNKQKINAEILKRQNSMGFLRNTCKLVKLEGRDNERK